MFSDQNPEPFPACRGLAFMVSDFLGFGSGANYPLLEVEKVLEPLWGYDNPHRSVSSSMALGEYLKDEMTLESRGPIPIYYESLYGI